jgi:hypothetical protein
LFVVNQRTAHCPVDIPSQTHVAAYRSAAGIVLQQYAEEQLVERLGAVDLSVSRFSMNIGAHLVDVWPLSTTGALCLAAVPPTENVRSVFNKPLMWGLSMTVVGATICYGFF